MILSPILVVTAKTSFVLLNKLLYTTLLPSTESILVHAWFSNPDEFKPNNQTSLLLIFSASIAIDWLGVGLLTLNFPASNLPWTNDIKKPVLALPAPWPSSLNNIDGLLPGSGASSIIFSPTISLLTTSKRVFTPSILLVNGYIADAVDVPLNLYFCVTTPAIVSVFSGFPIAFCNGNAEFKIFKNCSK